jgi:prefoldin subunit 2
MINGVLVERTVKDVIPSLKTNADGLKQVLDDLLRQYKSKQDEMEDWKVTNPAAFPPGFAKSFSVVLRKSYL